MMSIHSLPYLVQSYAAVSPTQMTEEKAITGPNQYILQSLSWSTIYFVLLNFSEYGVDFACILS